MALPVEYCSRLGHLHYVRIIHGILGSTMPFDPTNFVNNQQPAITAAQLNKLGTQYDQVVADIADGVIPAGLSEEAIAEDITDSSTAIGTALTATISTSIDEALEGFEPGTPLGSVYFGTAVDTARPEANVVIWRGDPATPLVPVNAEDGDIVIYPSTVELPDTWTFADVPNVAARFDAQALTGIADAANVTSWTNSVSGAPAAVPINSIPTMDVDGINGHRCVHFPNQGVLRSAGYSAFAGIHTVYMVARATDATDDFLLDANSSVDGGAIKLGLTRSATVFRVHRASAMTGTPPAADAAVHLFRGVWNGTTGTIQIDDDVPQSGTIGAAVNVTDYFLGGRADNANKLTGDIGEVIIIRGAVSSNDHVHIVDMLNAKWGLA